MTARQRQSVGREYALTRSQLMIWTGQHLQATDPLYNMALSFRIRGKIDVSCFATAFQALIDNSDALRTTFVQQEGVPKQSICESFAYAMPLLEMNETELDAWLREHAEKKFDLEECLFESTLIKLAENDYVWFFNQHHLTTDAWSTSLIFRYMQEYYSLAQKDRLAEADIPPSFSSYVDYETRQRNSKSMQRANRYWSQQLQFDSEPAEFYRSTPLDRSGRTLRVPCHIGTERSAKIHALSTTERFSALTSDLARFHVFATALFAWLHRLMGNKTVVVGTPNHNRGTSRFKKTIGLFIELYPLRVDIDAEETFATLHSKIARNSVELLMNAPSGASNFEHNRAYNVVLNYITAEFGEFDNLPVESEWVHANHGDRNHLVRMQVEDFDNNDEFRVFFDLNADTFVGADLDKPSAEFLRTVDCLLDDPDQLIDAVEIVPDTEWENVEVRQSNNGQRVDAEQSVLQMFDTQVIQSPHKSAIVCGDIDFSYEQLHQEIHRTTACLLASGVKRGERVAIMLPRSIDAVVGMLSIMRCGAAYVPVDASYPSERIANMLCDASVSWVLGTRNHSAAVPRNVTLITVGEGEVADAELPCLDEFDPSDSAYVMFTSGSTGRPKGVEVTHRNLSNYVCWASRYYLNGRALDWPLFSSLSFDLTVTSIFVPLISGGKIIVYPEPENSREITIRRVIEDNQVDIVKLTPAHLSLIQAMDLSQSRLGKLIVGGENFKSELARSITDYFGGRVDIYNEYGPTEGTVACTAHRFDPNSDLTTYVPIGTAIDNAQIYVLNRNRLLQPQGAVGELYIGGTGVARGYVNNPVLTDERFVENPYRPGESMYRTGDLARRHADGTLSCLGRTDDQFKLNGVRIEPGEIEAALLSHANVSDAAVRLVRRSADNSNEEERFCIRCGLSGMHPDAMLNDNSVCSVCRVYADEAERAHSYFRTLDDLREIVSDARTGAMGKQNCMMLLSGGKDSTYALCQLVELGLTPLVFTLDNGFISEGAKTNARRVVEDLGLELIEGSTEAMNAIFVDSLKRFSNVCNGCFKTIYTLSMKIARDRGIRHIFTGLSRGQIFETRVADLFRQRIFDSATIDRTIIDARKAYHRAHDAVSEHLDTAHFDDDSIFEEIQFVDYYRYTDVSLDTMLNYLRDKVPWVRPADTGRSTNCLINEAGIYVHKKERGYHNYSLPYSWDVRLGHKERDAAMDELDDDIDTDNVQRILNQIGYTPRESRSIESPEILVGYYVADELLPGDELKNSLAHRLPENLIPTHFMRLEELPLTPNGKLDRSRLPVPDSARPDTGLEFAPPTNQIESILGRVWSDILGIDRVGIDDNFFDLGGDSIMNIQIVAAATKQGVRLSPQQVFDYPTIRDLATVVGTADEIVSQQGPITGIVPLTPVQQRYLRHTASASRTYCQYVFLRSNVCIDVLILQEALRMLAIQHDSIRAQFRQSSSGWEQEFQAPDQFAIPIEEMMIDGNADEAIQEFLREQVPEQQEALDPESGPLVRVVVAQKSGTDTSFVLVLAHHLIVDAVSWWILVEDLERAYSALAAGKPVSPGVKTMSMRHWTGALQDYAQSAAAEGLPRWITDAKADIPELPVDAGLSAHNDLSSIETISITIGNADTRKLLTDAVAVQKIQPQDLLLTAFARAIASWSKQQWILVDLEAHGRELIAEDVDLLRTIGWFTSVYPVRLGALDETDSIQTLRQVRQKLREIPFGGVAYGAIREMHNSEDVRRQLEHGSNAQLLFNYLGQWRKNTTADAALIFEKPVMAAHAPDGLRQYVFEINMAVFDGQLRIEWSYSRNLHRRSTVVSLLELFGNNIRQLITDCTLSAHETLQPDDFPAANLSSTELDDILAEYGES